MQSLTLPVQKHALMKNAMLKSLGYKYFRTLRINYINVIEFFTRKYAPENLFAHAALKVYREKFLAKPQEYFYPNDTENISRILRKMTRHKFRNFLLVDCLNICAGDNRDIAQEILGDFCSVRDRKTFRRIFAHFYDDNNEKLPVLSRNLVKQISLWDSIRNFRNKPTRKILFTALMSAGKSTLINALVGKIITRTQNEACTGRIHRIYNKPINDGFVSTLENNLVNINANEKQFLDLDSDSSEISVFTFFDSYRSDNFRFCLIDTPGVNFSASSKHQHITQNEIKSGDWELLVYIINAQYIGTTDELQHLKFVRENVSANKIIFVLNKLDRYRTDDDNIPETISKLRANLEKIGFKSPVIFPVSAYAALLTKLEKITNTKLNDDELDELMLINMKFSKFQEYDLSRYNQTENSQENLDSHELLQKSGVLNLEKFLTGKDLTL